MAEAEQMLFLALMASNVACGACEFEVDKTYEKCQCYERSDAFLIGELVSRRDLFEYG